jgi:hypothetical protein
MRMWGFAQGWITLVGVALVAVGLLGYIENPIVGKASGALVGTNEVHNAVHLATGLLALYIAFGTRGFHLANGVIGFGLLYAVIFGAALISPNLFGLFGGHEADQKVHTLHGAVALVSLAVGFAARTETASRNAA